MSHPNDELGAITAFVYPQGQAYIDWIVQKDGEDESPYYKMWSLEGVPEPTVAETMAHEAEWLASFRQLRTIDAVYTDIHALTNPQKTSTWAWLMQSVSTPEGMRLRWRTSNQPAIWNSANVGTSAPAGSPLELQSRELVMAFWAIEHPADFVHPPWDPTINVPGDEPVP